ncbi:MAG: glycine C-acetyltransferase [Fimbriimonadia bacterium]|nr:glycine C-acetyltransferase [Fimbriimonadia bacterium]
MNTNFQSWIQTQMEELKAQNLYKSPPILESPQNGRVKMGGRMLINLASNNYLGLANDPRVVQAAVQAAQEWGAGAGAVRWLGGTNTLHETLENKLAEFKKTEAVLVFQSGFNANSGTIPPCFGEGDVIISDELNHASIIDGVRLSAAKYKKSDGYVYKHADMNHLEEILKRCGEFKKRLIVTDGVFSMDGDIAPLPDIVSLAEKYDAVVMVDDAHASGVLGVNGSGSTSHFGLYGRVDIQLGTLSKALGVVGGYIAGSALLKKWLINRGRPYLFSTALPPAAIGALIKAVEILQTDPQPMERLWENTRFWKASLEDLGFDTMGSETPITPVFCGDEGKAQTMERRLREEGVFTVSIVYPTVARGKARVRTMPSAMHTRQDLEDALTAFHKVGKELGII